MCLKISYFLEKQQKSPGSRGLRHLPQTPDASIGGFAIRRPQTPFALGGRGLRSRIPIYIPPLPAAPVSTRVIENVLCSIAQNYLTYRTHTMTRVSHYNHGSVFCLKISLWWYNWLKWWYYASLHKSYFCMKNANKKWDWYVYLFSFLQMFLLLCK